MVKDTIIHGLEDLEIKADVLGQQNQDMILEEVILFIEAKESGKRSQASLLSPDNAAASLYYQGNPKGPTVQKAENKSPCSYCGWKSQCDPHPTKCPAFGKVCTKCNRNDHFSKVCRSKPRKMVQISSPQVSPPRVKRIKNLKRTKNIAKAKIPAPARTAMRRTRTETWFTSNFAA